MWFFFSSSQVTTLEMCLTPAAALECGRFDFSTGARLPPTATAHPHTRMTWLGGGDGLPVGTQRGRGRASQPGEGAGPLGGFRIRGGVSERAAAWQGVPATAWELSQPLLVCVWDGVTTPPTAQGVGTSE